MSVCSAMSQGYIGYDLQNAIRAELISRGIYKPVATILTQVVIDPYDDAFGEPEKVIGRVLNAEEAEAEEDKGNFVTETAPGEYRRILAAPKPQRIVEIETVRALTDAGQVVAEFLLWNRESTSMVQVPSLRRILQADFLQRS